MIYALLFDLLAPVVVCAAILAYVVIATHRAERRSKP